MHDKKYYEIDIIDILISINKKKKQIFGFTLIFTLIGVFFSLSLPVKFSSSTIFIPQNLENTSSSLSGVASLVGISLGNSNYGGEISSSMYPQISQSTRFKRLLLEKNIDLKNELKLKDYLIDHYELSELSDKSNSKIEISLLEDKCFQIISNILEINVNKADGFVTIVSTMSNAEYSAFVADNAKEILQEIIISNKIESARQNLIFAESQLKAKKIEFNDIQNKLASFSDSNLNSVNSLVINERDKLEAEFEIISAVVTELSKQVEEAKLQVTKDTPVFSTIKESVIPNIKSSPKRTLIVILFTLIGFIFTTSFLFAKKPLSKFYSEIIRK